MGLRHLDAVAVRGVVDARCRRRQDGVETETQSKAGERTLALDPATVDALRAHRKRHAEERLAFGPGWQTDAADWCGQSRRDVVFTLA